MVGLAVARKVSLIVTAEEVERWRRRVGSTRHLVMLD